MKLIKKLELCTGIATPIATLFYICFGFLRIVFAKVNFTKQIDEEMVIFGIMFALILLASFMVAFGAYFDARGSDMAVGSLYAGGGFIIFILGLWGFFVLAYGGLLYGLLAYSPVILSAATIILALSSREKVSSNIFKL